MRVKNYMVQEQASHRIWKELMFPYHYGRVPDPTILTTPDAARFLWAFAHPFASDLMACVETNS